MNVQAADQISVNGSTVELEHNLPLAEVLRLQGVNPEAAQGVAVALNEEVIRRTAWQDTIVRPGDRIEIVTAQAGG